MVAVEAQVERDALLDGAAHAAQFRRDAPAELVIGQVEVLQVSQAAQLRGDAPAEPVVVERQRHQVRQAAQLRRNGPA